MWRPSTESTRRRSRRTAPCSSSCLPRNNAMNRHRRFAVALATSLAAFASIATTVARAAEPVQISISTANSALKLFVGDDGRLYESGYGAANATYELPKKLNRQEEFYPQYGDGFISDPALQITHADGNTSTSLAYVKHGTSEVDSNVSLTRIEL